MSEGFRFTYRTRAEFSDTDVTGVVYYGRYAAMFDRAVFAYRRHLGLDLLGPPGHHFLVRAMAAQYHGSLRFDDDVEVHVRIATLGRTSHSCDVRVERVDGDERIHCADGQVTVVGVDGYGETPRPSPIPAEVRRTIEQFEGLA